MKFLYFLFFTLIFFSCNQKQNNTIKKILNEDQLESQFFNININRDTTLITKEGCIIKIPKNSIESDSTNVKLNIKEALTVKDMLLAGLTTQSDKQALSSGGMIYLNASSGYTITIKKSIEVLVPTDTYNRDMKVYTGEKDNQDNINWKNPTPLPGDSTTIKIDEGQKLFKASCTSCHKIYENFVGPALYGVTERRTKKWLYDFTRHSLQMVSEQPLDIRDSINFYDPYSLCLKKKYGNVVMTPFPQLSDDVLDRLYSYIKTESDKRPDLKYQFKNTCCDSCEEYNKRIKILLKKKEELINENGDFFNLERIIPIPQINVPDNNSNVNNVPVIITPYSKVNPLSASAVYYTINISAVGWYNIDILMKEYSACQQSELFVRIQGGYKIDLNVVLIIPSVKAFVEGGKLKNNEQYGFDEDNGKIPLPQNVQSYILAFGEYENKIIFGKTIFNTQLQQTIDVAVAEITKGKMIAEVKAFNLDDVNMNIKKSKNSEITETNEELKESERLKPENCNCDSEPTTVPLPLNSK